MRSNSYLAGAHPEFEQVRGLLAAAASSGERVLLAHRTWPRETGGAVRNAVLHAGPADVSSGNCFSPTPAGQPPD